MVHSRSTSWGELPLRTRSASDSGIAYTYYASTGPRASGSETSSFSELASPIGEAADGSSASDQGTVTGREGSTEELGASSSTTDSDEGVTAENAQSIYHPGACLFVANLDRNRSATELAEAVGSLFSNAGKCWVKIRVDSRNIPFAFVQYKDVLRAANAALLHRGTRIFGRPCRIEHIKAHRVLYVTRRDEYPPDEDDVVDLIRGFGPVDRTWIPTIMERTLYNLVDGIFVRFELWQDAQDAMALLATDPTYRFRINPTRPRPYHYRPIPGRVNPLTVFVGDLPLHVSYHTLHVYFRRWGAIDDLDIERQPITNHSYAFVRYYHPFSATAATQVPMQHICGDRLSRVQRKRIRVNHAEGWVNPYPQPEYHWDPDNSDYVPRSFRR